MNEKQWAKEVWEKLDKKLSRTAVSSYDKIPYTTVDGIHDNRFEKDPCWWTNGFWPALMVLMYAGTKKEQYLKTARHGMDILDKALMNFDGLHHDVGFMWNISSGTDYQITGDLTERNRFLIAANHLMGRYNSNGEYIVAWNGEQNKGWAIIDCMMNIPLLYRASIELKDDRYAMIARNHANKTMKYHVREDGSCNHINEYNPLTGEFICDHGGQGYADGTSWSRGQSWAIYGYALSYRYTKDEAYLATAKKVANYFIANVQATDWTALCDFRQPEDSDLIDTTANAIAACGMLEIAEHVPENEKKMYHDAAVKLLAKAEEKYCDWSDEEDSILQMGTEAHNFGGKHIPIIYGDYFFAEGIYRLMGYDANILW